ncbi:hypothetical protein [Haliangium ochraceum]|uniref:Uncharacterized protein n=1 Tax=Haliangium ochraceum (strain DSM 14365 / JCM 11303 / SMP-2) TaxID=502025 RepID=D0LV73_HALO1|nr:hypothetical protein [Haliangium ochraceum]ACY15914.1 hypothetical protein Hoch_3412 [Haliangium ochraceum DSM 14365]
MIESFHGWRERAGAGPDAGALGARGLVCLSDVPRSRCVARTRRPRPLLAVLVIACAAASSLLLGCVRPLPEHPSTAALYRDLERLVTVREASGWEIDRLEVDAMLSAAMMSACQVTPVQRAELLAWMDTRIQDLGGPILDAYHRSGNQLSGHEELLSITRARLLLDRADARAAEDCPFWLESGEHFAGRQISDDRWQVSLSSGGRGNLVVRGDQADLQFGGASRALIGRVFDNSMALYTGLELAAGASVPKDEDGERTSLVLGVDLIAPVTWRYYWVNTFFDIETGYVAHATEEDWRDIDHGVHFGVYVAGRSTRVRWFFPGAGFGASYDAIFRTGDDRKTLHVLSVGFRGSFDFDL